MLSKSVGTSIKSNICLGWSSPFKFAIDACDWMTAYMVTLLSWRKKQKSNIAKLLVRIRYHVISKPRVFTNIDHIISTLAQQNRWTSGLKFNWAWSWREAWKRREEEEDPLYRYVLLMVLEKSFWKQLVSHLFVVCLLGQKYISWWLIECWENGQ